MSSNQNRIRDIILEEGIEARNVINWRVQPKQTNERPSTGDANNNNNRGELTNINKSKGEKQVFSGSNLTTASMRLWKLIFENVLRSVDELHHFCEDEQSVELAEQGFQFCLSSCRDFAQLVQKFEKEKEKEKDKDKDKEKIELIMPPLSTKHRAVVGTPNTSSTPSAVLLPASAPDAEAAAMVEPTVTTTAVTTTAVVVTVNADANSISSTSPSPAESSCLKMPKLRAAAVPFVPRSVVQPSHQLNEQPQEEKEVHDNLTTSTQLLNNSTVADPPIISTESKLLLSNDNDSKTNTASNEASENIMNSNRPKSPLKVAVAIMSKSTRTTTNTTTVSNSTPATKASKLSVINKVSLNKTRAPQTSVNKPTRSETHSTQSKRDFNTQSQVESKQRDDRSVSCSRRSQSEDQSRCDSSTSVDSLDALDLSEIEQLEVVRASEAVWAEAEAWIEAEAAVEEEAWQAILDDTSLEDLLMQHRKSHLAASATDVKVVGEVSQVISESEHINKGGSGQSDGIINVADAVTVTSSSETSPRCSKLRTDLRVSPSAEYVGIHLPDSKVDVTVICDEPNTATSESSRRLLASTDEPISSSSFLESSFLRDHLAEGGISPDRNSGDRPRSTFRFSASNTPVGDNSNTAFGFGHGSDSIKWKLQAPEVVRDRTVEERKQKARIVSHRAKVITEKQAVRLAKAEMKLDTRLRGAEQRHTEYVKAIKGRAGNENAKVSEVHFINTINEEHLVSELQQRLEEVEARILAAANRRSERLQDIAVQQKKRNHKKIQQMSELRLQLERQRMERWEKLQRRIEAVQNRREARLLEMKNLLSRRSVVSAEPSMSDPSPVPDKKLITDTDGAVTEGIVTINNSHHGCTDVKTLPHISSTDKFSPESTTSVTSLVTGNTTVNVKPPVARTTSAGRRQSTDGGMASVLKSTASSEAKKAKKADTTGSSKGSSQSNITSENNSKFTKKKAKVEQVDSNSSTLISASLVLKDNKIIDGASKDKNNECVDIDSKINTDRSQEDINVEKGNSNNESRDCTEGITSTECTPVKTKKTRPKKKKAKKAVIESINSETTIESVVNTESTEESNDPVDSFVAAYRSWQRNQALKDVVEARADLNNNHNRYDKDNITVHTESVFGNGKYPTATNFMVSNTSVLPSASDHSTSDNLSNKVNIHVTESVYQATLQSHVDQLRTLLLSHESVLRLSFIAFNSTAFRGTITGNAEANSDPELALRHLWTCVASILGSPHFRETVHFDRLWSFRLVELFLLLLDESHGILSSADRFKYAVTQPGLLFALSACFRSAVLLDGACAVLIDKHSYLLSRFIDLTSLLLYWTNQLPHDVSNESTQQESGQLRTQVLQSLSILLNALHFIPQYLSTPDFSFIPSSSSQKQQKQQEQRQEYEKQRLSQNKWNDSQSRLVWYMSSCHLLVGTIEYLNSFSIQFLQQQWSRQIFTTDNNMERIDPTYPTIELLQLDLRSYSSADKKTRMKSDEKLLGEYEMLCGGVELCWAIASYLRLSAGMSDSTVVHDIDQLRTRLRHRHTRGRQMLSGPHSPLMAVSTHLLGVTYRIHKNDEIIPNKSDSFLSSVSKVDTTWSLPISSTTQSLVLSDSLSTILTLVTDTLCVLSEADIGLHRRLAKQTRMDLVTHLGALLAVTGSSVTQSALQTSVLRVLGLIYLSAPSEPMPTCNASVQLNDHILLVTRQEGLLLPSQVLTRLQEMLVASENITKDDDTVVNDINIVVNDSPWSKVGQAALIRAVLLNMLHSCDLLMPSTELTFSSNSISTASVNNIREYFQLRMQELKRQRQPLKPVISTTDCSSSHSLSQSILLLSHVAPVCLWTSQNLESNQVM